MDATNRIHNQIHNLNLNKAWEEVRGCLPQASEVTNENRRLIPSRTIVKVILSRSEASPTLLGPLLLALARYHCRPFSALARRLPIMHRRAAYRTGKT